MSNITVTDEEILEEPCERCGVEAGENCKALTGSGRKVPFHQERGWAVQRKKSAILAEARKEEAIAKAATDLKQALVWGEKLEAAGITRALIVTPVLENDYQTKMTYLRGYSILEAYNVLTPIVGTSVEPEYMMDLVAQGVHVRVVSKESLRAPSAGDRMADMMGLYTHGPWWAKIGR